MSTLSYYYQTIIKQDLITKFSYENVSQLPAIQKICLNFQVSQSSLKHILPLMSGMTLISFQKPFILTSNRTNLVLKLKKGLPIGCMVTLRKETMFLFLERFLFLSLPQFKGSLKPVFRIGEKSVFFTLENPFFFREIEKEYEKFQHLPKLSMTLVTNTKKKEEILALLRGLKFPLSY